MIEPLEPPPLSLVAGPPPDETRALPVLREIAAAATRAEVAEAAVRGVLRLMPARGAALGLRADRSVELLASSGYDCDAMRAGARLPLDAGLPLTEAARTGRSVLQPAPGGGWVALPLAPTGPPGALLVSLAPVGYAPPMDQLLAFATDVGRALSRADRHDRALARAAAAGPLLAPGPVLAPARIELAARVVPLAGDLGGDLVETVCDDRGCWVVIADACGSGPEAAAAAAAVRLGVRALVPHVAGPAALLAELDRVLVAEPLLDRFVSAVALRVTADRDALTVRVASAGHPAPLLRADGGIAELRVGGPLLGLGLGGAGVPDFVEADARLLSGEVLVAFTDGMLDRRHNDASRDLPDLLAANGTMRTANELAGALLAGLAARCGPARDDVAIAVVRCPGAQAPAAPTEQARALTGPSSGARSRRQSRVSLR